MTEKNKAAQELGRKGGQVRAARMKPEERKASARKAWEASVAARLAKKVASPE